MIDWDDIRYFLPVARGGSVRAVAERLNVNHSTVLRRIGQLENHLGAHMFEKLPSGYRLTNAGEEVLQFADQMEAWSNRLQTRVFGRDQSVRGLLRVTLAPSLATHLLMPDFADFARLHPEIEMEILSIDHPVNLTNRQADVAIRVFYEQPGWRPWLNNSASRQSDWGGSQREVCLSRREDTPGLRLFFRISSSSNKSKPRTGAASGPIPTLASHAVG